MKLHIGVDNQSGLSHSAVVTPANIHDTRCRSCYMGKSDASMVIAPMPAKKN